jgi:uncharacterized membrane protein
MSVSGLVFLVIWGLLIVALLVLFWNPQRSRTKASTLIDRQRVDAILHDDDRYWYGLFYNNPDDPALFVPKRYGRGWTINFGHPQGKLVMIGTLLLPLVLLILSILLTGGVPTGCHTLGCHP